MGKIYQVRHNVEVDQRDLEKVSQVFDGMATITEKLPKVSLGLLWDTISDADREAFRIRLKLSGLEQMESKLTVSSFVTKEVLFGDLEGSDDPLSQYVPDVNFPNDIIDENQALLRLATDGGPSELRIHYLDHRDTQGNDTYEDLLNAQNYL